MGFGKDKKGVIIRDQSVITLGTLASGAVIKAGSAIEVTEDFRLLKTEYTVYVEGFTDNEGPLQLLMSDNELTVAEIAEALNAEGPIDRNDRASMEKATRPVWQVGMVGNNSNDGEGFQPTMEWKGKPWTFSSSEGFTWAVMNNSGAQLTTGTIIRVVSTFYGVWVT